MGSKSAKESLAAARNHKRGRRYQEALEEYEWFFDNSLDDQESLYGVRLSYCLAEWHDVGKKYPPALERLASKRQECFEEFLQTGEDERFHDFSAISEELNDDQEVVNHFLMLDEQHTHLATTAWRFARQLFVDRENWEICSKYLSKPILECERAVRRFLGGMSVYQEEPKLFENSDAEIVGWLIEDGHSILQILRHSERQTEEVEALRYMSNELKREGYEKHISALSSYS